ncbi:DEAD/DEAH box helicase [Paenibacillus agri]|uniref:DEAD/DEAH box helicase n=1 Tax=Paenibacillus agri TaxID=2744309 RepID=A0A850EK07_9BACL|nr:DEAD/DEAH box helicase [Paenibacillus agri]NUU60140.1 DEAD/DEAH box helicase [Paenibacillus agri]
MPGFKDLGVSEVLTGLLQGQGIVQPTPVQQEAIPPVVQGLDVIARAKTGTGKTLAFLLPILDKIYVERAYPQALILAPTRELALQITEEARKLARHTGVKILAVYGGQDVEKQLRKLEGGRHLIIGTPGRLLDHLRRETLDLSGVKMLVLDEADQMLHMGFLEDVETIITAVPYRRQTMLFSATMPDPIKRLAANYMKEPLDIVIKSGSPIPLDNIRQQVVECSDRNKEEALQALIERDRPYLAMIFCRTKRRVSKLNETLRQAGYECDELHGDLSQAKREAVMKRFRDAKLQLLVATDVAARGLDVEGVTHVFNYDMPLDVDSYIHRIGRTGRAGGKGLAITFASPRDWQGLDMIEQGISQRLDRRRYEKDEFGVGEFSAAAPSGGNRQGSRRGAATESARTGRGPKPGGRGAARSGAAPRAEAGARQGGNGRGRAKEAAVWEQPAASSRPGRSAQGGNGRGRAKEAAVWEQPAAGSRPNRSAQGGNGRGRAKEAAVWEQPAAGSRPGRGAQGGNGPRSGYSASGPRSGSQSGNSDTGSRGGSRSGYGGSGSRSGGQSGYGGNGSRSGGQSGYGGGGSRSGGQSGYGGNSSRSGGRSNSSGGRKGGGRGSSR